jgi:hypothetical protein
MADQRPSPDAGAPGDEPDARDAAHDVLAAEEFGMPAPDPALHHEPAHDVLAAEEFAMPAPRSPGSPAGAAGIAARAATPARIGALAAVALLIRRVLRRRRS